MSDFDPLDARAVCEAARTEDNSCAASEVLYQAAVEMTDRGTAPRLFADEAEHAALLIFGVLGELYAARSRIAELGTEIRVTGVTKTRPDLH
jgi:hypothetical protein